MLFEAQGAGVELTWGPGDEDLGPADRVIAWRPRPGRHTLRLVDGARRAVDAISFEVRGRSAP